MKDTEPTEVPMCDFCWDPKWARRFYCGVNDWRACSTCGSFIDSENWNALLLRAVEKLSQTFSETPRRILTDNIKRSHDVFREGYVKAKS